MNADTTDTGSIYPVDLPSTVKDIAYAVCGTSYFPDRGGGETVLGETGVSSADRGGTG